MSKLLASLDRARGRRTSAELSEMALRFREQLAAIESIDFFQANGREQSRALVTALESRATSTVDPTKQKSMSESQTELSGRTWVTRANVHVDRMASAWLIRRSIDPAATFKFVTDRHYRPNRGELRFDMYDAEYTHDAGRCTFEVLLDLVDGPDPALRR